MFGKTENKTSPKNQDLAKNHLIKPMVLVENQLVYVLERHVMFRHMHKCSIICRLDMVKYQAILSSDHCMPIQNSQKLEKKILIANKNIV